MQFQDQSVLITGGSRGLGLALGTVLARAGARVVLVSRGHDELMQAVHALRTQGHDVHGIVADIADKNAIYPLAARAAALVGPIDMVIHNASTLGPLPLQLLLDTDCEDLEHVLAVNVIGPFRLTKALAGAMVLRGHGVVLHISSDAAVEAYPSWGAYGISKAALDHLSRCLAAELEEEGIRVLSIDPGEMDTQMHADAVPDADRQTLAQPNAVAAKMLRALERLETLPPGARLRVSDWEG